MFDRDAFGSYGGIISFSLLFSSFSKIGFQYFRDEKYKKITIVNSPGEKQTAAYRARGKELEKSTCCDSDSTMVFDDAHVLDSLSMASMALEAKNRTIARLQEQLNAAMQANVTDSTEEEEEEEEDQSAVMRGVGRDVASRRDSHDSTATSGSLVLLLQETLDELHTSRVTVQVQAEEIDQLSDRIARLQALSPNEEGKNVRDYYEALLEEKESTIKELASMLASRDAFAENVRAFLQQHASSLPSSPTSRASSV